MYNINNRNKSPILWQYGGVMMEKLMERFMFDFDITREEAEEKTASANVTEYKKIEEFNEAFNYQFESFEGFLNSGKTQDFTSTFYEIDGILYMVHHQ